MIRSTVRELIDSGSTATGVYVVRDGRRTVYVGRTRTLGIGRRMYRHLHDGGKQERCCKLSPALRRSWPRSGDWTVEVWSPSEVSCRFGFTHPSKTYGIAWAETTMMRELHPDLNTVGGQTPAPKWEQPSLWGLPT